MENSSPTGPVEELRAAATLIREKAKYATGGPWTCSPVWSPDGTGTSGVYSLAHPTGTVKSEVVASGRIKSGYGGIRNPHNAVWITLMQPRIAEPIAAWLESEAEHAKQGIVRDLPECPSCGDGCGGHDEQDFHDGTDDRAGCERPFGDSEDNRCACFDLTLAVARAILGTDSDGSEAGR